MLPADLGSLADAVADQLTGAEAALLSYDSRGPCQMSLEGSIQLLPSRVLALPIDVRQPHSGGAYIITREACERMIKCMLPVRVQADAWWFFYKEGVLDRVRCVVPLPVRKNPKLTSTIGSYSLGSGVRARLVGPLVRHKIPFLYQALCYRRAVLSGLCLGQARGPRSSGSAPHDHEREHHCEQPDHHERERQSAAHGHPFQSKALGAPLCCDIRYQGYALERAFARRLRPTLMSPFVSGWFASAGFLCSVRQHLAAVRLRLDNLFIKQTMPDRCEPCAIRTKSAGVCGVRAVPGSAPIFASSRGAGGGGAVGWRGSGGSRGVHDYGE